jgi:hypothetical protein
MQLFARHVDQAGTYKFTAAALANYAIQDAHRVVSRLHELALELNEPARIAYAKAKLDGFNAVATEFMGIVTEVIKIGRQTREEKFDVERYVLTSTSELKLSNRETSRFLPMFERSAKLVSQSVQASSEAPNQQILVDKGLTCGSNLNPEAAPFLPGNMPIAIQSPYLLSQ